MALGKFQCIALVVALATASNPANAQVAAEAPVGNGSSAEVASPDIVVTAQKRVERLLSVPIPVTAIMPADLVGQNQTRLQDYFSKIPGLSLLASGSGQVTLAVRGISTSSSSNPTVGIVIDDIPFGASSVTSYSSRLIPDLDPSDLARVEVLRGPQGTLYGASSMGGLLKYVTIDPSTRGVSGSVQGDVSTIKNGELSYGLRGGLNLPVSSELAVRVSGFGRHDGGYVDNVTTGEKDVNSTKAYGGRVSVLWRPSDGFSWKLGALLQNMKGHGTNEVDADSELDPTLGSLQQTRLPNTGQFESKIRLYTSQIEADLGFADLSFLTGYGETSYLGVYDSTPSYGGFARQIFGPGVTGGIAINDYKTTKFTQEIRLDRSFGDLIDVTIGGYYGRERTKGLQLIQGANPATGAGAGTLARITSRTELDELAGFGAATLHLGQFNLLVGGRYADNDQGYPRTAAGPLVGNGTTNIGAKSSLGTFLVSPQYKFSEDVMVYGRVASGYRIGGPNPNAAAGAPASYEPDKTINYELGLKGTFFDRVLTVDASVFHISWKDIQLSLTNPSNGLTYFTNGPKAKSEGVEAAVTVAPAPGFSIVASGSYNAAELTENLPAGGGAGFDGDRLPFSSRFSSSVTADGKVPISEVADLSFGATLTYVGARYGDFQRAANLIRTRYPSYVTLDLRAGVEQGPWSLDAFMSNVGDKRGIIGGSVRGLQATAVAPYQVIYVRPRTIGLSLARTF